VIERSFSIPSGDENHNKTCVFAHPAKTFPPSVTNHYARNLSEAFRFSKENAKVRPPGETGLALWIGIRRCVVDVELPVRRRD
jgi:hypothetical protein